MTTELRYYPSYSSGVVSHWRVQDGYVTMVLKDGVAIPSERSEEALKKYAEDGLLLAVEALSGG